MFAITGTNASATAPAKPAAKASAARGLGIRRSGALVCVANSGASTSGANFVSPASATIAPRATGRPATHSAASTSSATSASLEFVIDAYSVNGNVTQQYASTIPRSGPRTRRPTRKHSRQASRSKVTAAKWAAGRSSHFPLHGMTCSNGMYAR